MKVHYDVAAWNLDQRGELTAALAEEEITHVWDGDELIVPEELEGRTDELFARLDDELGPFPIVLDEEETAVEFELDEWPDEDRATLTAALVEAAIAHRWNGATVFVAAEAEPTVDELLDGIEAGTIVAGAAGAPTRGCAAPAVRRRRPARQGPRRRDRSRGAGRAGRRTRSGAPSVRIGQEHVARHRRRKSARRRRRAGRTSPTPRA